jgi:hypothetical protein
MVGGLKGTVALPVVLLTLAAVLAGGVANSVNRGMSRAYDVTNSVNRGA